MRLLTIAVSCYRAEKNVESQNPCHSEGGTFEGSAMCCRDSPTSSLASDHPMMRYPSYLPERMPMFLGPCPRRKSGHLSVHRDGGRFVFQKCWPTVLWSPFEVDVVMSSMEGAMVFHESVSGHSAPALSCATNRKQEKIVGVQYRYNSQC